MGSSASVATKKRPERMANGDQPGSQRMKIPAVAQVAVERRAIAIPRLSSLVEASLVEVSLGGALLSAFTC